jgi:thiol-disulfide isomerase/thioredoxin
MEITMHKLIIPLFALIAFAMPLQAGAMDGVKPAVYAVAFHADWCGSCKVLAPHVEKARAKADLDNMDVLFVKLDLTDSTTRHQSGLLASALGMGDYYAANDGKTGFMLLVDPATGKEVGKINKDMDASQITALIEKTIKAQKW